MNHKFRYTVCVYYPDLYQTDTFYPFAVLVARENEILLSGVDLEECGVKPANATERMAMRSGIEMVDRVVDGVLMNCGCKSGLDALDKIVSGNMSSIQFWPFEETEGTSLQDVGNRLVVEKVIELLQRKQKPKQLGLRWSAKPKVDSREKDLVGAN